MDTTTGRFISMDSYLGSVDDPVAFINIYMQMQIQLII